MREIIEYKSEAHPDTLTDLIVEECATTLDNYYKKEITKAHNKGKLSVTDGMPRAPINGRKPLDNQKPPNPPRETQRISMEDLHNEE